MECAKNLDTKYQNLASEYSKLRANAAVLKKAVLDEQARSRELKDQLKDHEQKLRKSNQEMESLTFRNLQLTKRISVLQEELEVKTVGRRPKGKSNMENAQAMSNSNVTLLDEELQKKIIDNAQLISAMTDKDLEISNLREIVTELEERLLEEHRERGLLVQKHRQELEEVCRRQCEKIRVEQRPAQVAAAAAAAKECGESSALRQQLERWRSEYELLVGAGTADDSGRLDGKHFYVRIDALMSERQEAEGRASSLAAECAALELRLEHALAERSRAEATLGEDVALRLRLQEELATTTHNYEQQLSTMSEHLADLNDKYTEQSELLHQLQFQLHNNGSGSAGTRKSK